MKTQVTRTAFCPRCFANGKAKTDDVYAVRGSRGWHVLQVKYAVPHTNTPGFTPHVFELDNSERGHVFGTMTCCMQECGMDIRENPEYETNHTKVPYLSYFKERRGFKMKLQDWNALVLNKDLGYKIDDE